MIVPFVLFVVQAQDGKPVHPGRKSSPPTVEDTRSVTANEVAQTFTRVATLFLKADGIDLGRPSIPSLDRPATRAEIVVEMDRIYTAAAPKLRFTPAPIRHDPSVFRIDAPHRPALERLVSVGCVARIGPLVVGPSSGLSPREFGDAVGFMMARLAQMSHMPSPKWTPNLKND